MGCSGFSETAPSQARSVRAAGAEQRWSLGTDPATLQNARPALACSGEEGVTVASWFFVHSRGLEGPQSLPYPPLQLRQHSGRVSLMPLKLRLQCPHPAEIAGVIKPRPSPLHPPPDRPAVVAELLSSTGLHTARGGGGWQDLGLPTRLWKDALAPEKVDGRWGPGRGGRAEASSSSLGGVHRGERTPHEAGPGRLQPEQLSGLRRSGSGR